MVSSDLNYEMSILNGFKLYRPVNQIHSRETINIDDHLFETNSLSLKLSIILVDFRLNSLKLHSLKKKSNLKKKLLSCFHAVKSYPVTRISTQIQIRGKTQENSE